MKEFLNRAARRPAVAHLLRAGDRFTRRLGGSFAAAITYFSVLSLVPLLMLAFSLLGLTLTRVRPDWLATIKRYVVAVLAASDELGRQASDLIDQAVGNWQAIGLVGLATALWSGTGWVANLKSAVRLQWRHHLHHLEPKHSPVVEWLANLGILAGLLTCVGVTFTLLALATSLAGYIGPALHLDSGSLGWVVLIRLVPVLASLIAGFLLFLFLFRVLPDDKEPWEQLAPGAALGAVGMTSLQLLTSVLIGLFASNPAATLFGPVIALMLFLNLFAQLILFLSAWIATATVPVSEPGTTPSSDEGEVPAVVEPFGIPEGHVAEEVARKAMRVGMGAGYVAGAATGLAVGAVVVAALERRGKA